MTWHEEHPGGIIACDAPGCTRTRRNYCSPTERELWVAYQRGNVVLDLCPAHRGARSSSPEWLTNPRKAQP